MILQLIRHKLTKKGWSTTVTNPRYITQWITYKSQPPIIQGQKDPKQ